MYPNLNSDLDGLFKVVEVSKETSSAIAPGSRGNFTLTIPGYDGYQLVSYSITTANASRVEYAERNGDAIKFYLYNIGSNTVVLKAFVRCLYLKTSFK